MSEEVELISDGDGVAIVGEPSAVERFIAASGLSTVKVSTAFTAGAKLAQTGAAVANSSGRWVKLTEDSAAKLIRGGLSRPNSPRNHQLPTGRGFGSP